MPHGTSTHHNNKNIRNFKKHIISLWKHPVFSTDDSSEYLKIQKYF
jgi:hypothetical protein